MGIGERLKEFRIDKKLNQDKLAEIMKVKQATISAYELNKTFPSLESIIGLHERYNDIDLHWLITGVKIADTNQPDNLQLRLDEYQRTIAVYEKAIEMLYDKYKSNK